MRINYTVAKEFFFYNDKIIEGITVRAHLFSNMIYFSKSLTKERNYNQEHN